MDLARVDPGQLLERPQGRPRGHHRVPEPGFDVRRREVLLEEGLVGDDDGAVDAAAREAGRQVAPREGGLRRRGQQDEGPRARRRGLPGPVELERRVEARRREGNPERALAGARLQDPLRQRSPDRSEGVLAHRVVVREIAGELVGRPREPARVEVLDHEAPRDERPACRHRRRPLVALVPPGLPDEPPHTPGGEPHEGLEEVAETDRGRRRDVHGRHEVHPGCRPGQRGHRGRDGDEGSRDGPARVLGASRERAHGAPLRLQRGDPRVRARHEVRAGREGWGKTDEQRRPEEAPGRRAVSHGAASVARFAFPAEPSPSRGRGRRPRTRARRTRGPPGPCPRGAARRRPPAAGPATAGTARAPAPADHARSTRASAHPADPPGPRSPPAPSRAGPGSYRSRVRRKVSRPIRATRLSRTSMLASVCEPGYAPPVASRRTAPSRDDMALRWSFGGFLCGETQRSLGRVPGSCRSVPHVTPSEAARHGARRLAAWRGGARSACRSLASPPAELRPVPSCRPGSPELPRPRVPTRSLRPHRRRVASPEPRARQHGWEPGSSARAPPFRARLPTAGGARTCVKTRGRISRCPIRSRATRQAVSVTARPIKSPLPHGGLQGGSRRPARRACRAVP